VEMAVEKRNLIRFPQVHIPLLSPSVLFKPNKHLPYSLFLNFLIQDLINFFCPIPSFLFQVLIAGELSVRNIKKTKDIRS